MMVILKHHLDLSPPRYGGYPCGLWSLWHSLTISQAAAHTGDPRFDLISEIKTEILSILIIVPHKLSLTFCSLLKLWNMNIIFLFELFFSHHREVLKAMQGFIEHFFGCRECARYLNCVKDNELYDSCTLKHLLVNRWNPNSHLF